MLTNQMTGSKTRGQRSQFDYHSCVSLIVGLIRARAGMHVSGAKAANRSTEPEQTYGNAIWEYSKDNSDE